jgi:hypothetical protein
VRFAPPARRAVLAVHLVLSVGWIGAVLAYVVLAFAPIVSRDPESVRSAWICMDLIGWWVIVPLAVGALLSGIALSLGTKWGLLRHYWVVMSFAGTIVGTGVLIVHMPAVDALARAARTASADAVLALPADLMHPIVGLVLLVGILVLNIVKPKGLTRRGWRFSQRGAARVVEPG